MREHIVQAGDTLSKLARLYYGNAALWRRIMAYNALSSTTLRIGQRLLIPDKEEPNKSVAEAIVEYALTFNGLREVKPNSIWTDKTQELRTIMEPVGWRPGDAYCMAFAAGVWRAVFDRLQLPQPLRRCLAWFTPGVTMSWQRIPESHRQSKPAKGAIFFLQLPNSWKGHAGIVIDWRGANLETIEGNTSGRGTVAAERQGDFIMRRNRFIRNGRVGPFKLLGFLHPPERTTQDGK